MANKGAVGECTNEVAADAAFSWEEFAGFSRGHREQGFVFFFMCNCRCYTPVGCNAAYMLTAEDTRYLIGHCGHVPE